MTKRRLNNIKLFRYVHTLDFFVVCNSSYELKYLTHNFKFVLLVSHKMLFYQQPYSKECQQPIQNNLPPTYQTISIFSLTTRVYLLTYDLNTVFFTLNSLNVNFMHFRNHLNKFVLCLGF